MPAGVAHSIIRHAFVGGTAARGQDDGYPVNKGRKSTRNAAQALTVREERADRIEGFPQLVV